MSGLAALLERLRAATGGDRELDAEICAHFRLLGEQAMRERWIREWEGPVKAVGERVYLIHSNGSHGLWSEARPVTTSLDGALALVQAKLPGWCWQAAGYHEAGAWGAVWRTTERVWSAEAATPALSILCALLVALIAEQTS